MLTMTGLFLFVGGTASSQEANRPLMPTEKPVVSFSPEQARQWIPFSWEPGGLIVIPVQLEGAPALALLDTGFASVVLAHAYATAKDLPMAGIGDAVSVGGATKFEVTPDIALDVGGLHQAGGAMQVVDLSGVNARLPKPVDIVLGLSLLSHFALQVDFDNQRLRLLPSGSREMAGTDIPVGLDAKGERVILPASVDGSAIGPTMIDLGSTGEVALAQSAESLLPATRQPATDIAEAGAGGIQVSKLIALDGFAIGNLRSGPLLATVEAREGFLSGAGVAASIGLGVLGRYNFVLDIMAGRLTLAPRSRPDPVQPRSHVGIQGNYDADRLTIVHVMQHSPAERAGLRKQDAICSVDGEGLVGWKGAEKTRWTRARAGKVYSLGLCDGRTIKLKAATFY